MCDGAADLDGGKAKGEHCAEGGQRVGAESFMGWADGVFCVWDVLCKEVRSKVLCEAWRWDCVLEYNMSVIAECNEMEVKIHVVVWMEV